ncbi:ETS-related transcription factor Elf-5, partial [Armadillidium nasatum]
GETRVSDERFISLCKVAKSLQIKGFDRLELYREASKETENKDALRYTNRNSDFGQPCAKTSFESKKESDSLSPKPCYYFHEREQLENAVNLYDHKIPGKNVNDCSDCFTAIQSKSEGNSPMRDSVSPQAPKQSPFSSSLSLQSPTEERKLKCDETSSVSSSEKCSHTFPSCYNFKKKYLLSLSQKLIPQPKFETPPMKDKPPPTDLLSKKPDGDAGVDESSSSSVVPICRKDDYSSSSENSCEMKCPVAGSKPLRNPPPLLRIRYNSSPEDDISRPETENIPMQLKQETSNQFPYDYSLTYGRLPQIENRLPQIDDYFQTTLISEPWNDPLLQKIPTNKRKRVRGPKSWEFLLRLLRSPESNPSLIKWENEEAGVFRLIRPEIIALRWGRRTGKHVHDILSYESFSRGLRYHYATGALCAVSEKSFVYQFGPKAQEALRASKQNKSEPSTEQ